MIKSIFNYLLLFSSSSLYFISLIVASTSFNPYYSGPRNMESDGKEGVTSSNRLLSNQPIND